MVGLVAAMQSPAAVDRLVVLLRDMMQSEIISATAEEACVSISEMPDAARKLCDSTCEAVRESLLSRIRAKAAQARQSLSQSMLAALHDAREFALENDSYIRLRGSIPDDETIAAAEGTSEQAAQARVRLGERIREAMSGSARLEQALKDDFAQHLESDWAGEVVQRIEEAFHREGSG